jgi:hypothetical protein
VIAARVVSQKKSCFIVLVLAFDLCICPENSGFEPKPAIHPPAGFVGIAAT